MEIKPPSRQQLQIVVLTRLNAEMGQMLLAQVRLSLAGNRERYSGSSCHGDTAPTQQT
jgi:hypothetical protein